MFGAFIWPYTWVSCNYYHLSPHGHTCGFVRIIQAPKMLGDKGCQLLVLGHWWYCGIVGTHVAVTNDSYLPDNKCCLNNLTWNSKPCFSLQNSLIFGYTFSMRAFRSSVVSGKFKDKFTTQCNYTQWTKWVADIVVHDLTCACLEWCDMISVPTHET